MKELKKGVAMGKWQEVTYLGRKDWDKGLATFDFDLAETGFLAGQFIQVGIENDEGKMIPRAYSIGSAPNSPLELYIVLVDEGKLTPKLFNLKPGDKVSMAKKFAGHFHLDRVGPAKNLWLAGTGTGLAPYISMVREGKCWDMYEKVIIYHGVRNAAQLAYADELLALEKERPDQFFYLPTVSGENVENTFHGRITTTWEEAIAKVGGPIEPEGTRFMLCGNRAMINDMVSQLGDLGLHRALRATSGQIHSEVYF
jgi:ferredoxin--NADP+ reductase